MSIEKQAEINQLLTQFEIYIILSLKTPKLYVEKATNLITRRQDLENTL